MNKFDHPVVAEMGGIAVLAGFLVSYFSVSFLMNWNFESTFLPVIVIFLVGGYGLLDDIYSFNLKKRSKSLKRQCGKALLIALCSLPLVLYRVGNPSVVIPLIGIIDFGVYFWLLLVPLAISGGSNLTNLLAGLNGLEIGAGLIACISLLIVAILLEVWSAALILIMMTGCLLAFLYFNKHPAKIFPGDTGTLIIGAAIGAAAILGKFEFIGIIVLFPQILEFIISLRVGLNAENFGIPQPNGKLLPMSPKQSLTHFFMSFGDFSELQIVIQIWIFCILFGVLGILTALFCY